MNKRGIYTAVIALVVLAILSASIAHVLSFRTDYKAEYVSSIPGEVQFAAVNARYIVDRAVANELYNAAMSGCSVVAINADILATTINDDYLSKMDGEISCWVSEMGLEGQADKTDYSFKINCKHSAAGVTYMFPSGGPGNKIYVEKTVTIVDSGPPCVVEIDDDQSGKVELPIS